MTAGAGDMQQVRQVREIDVPVRGGPLRVGIWEPTGAHRTDPGGADSGSGVTTVLAIHGITSSHRAFLALARAVPDIRLVAPDLRGRAGSADLPGPWGLGTHAEDVAVVLERCTAGPVVVVGHSMGAFVAVLLAHARPDLVRSLVLVDGGVPFPLPDGVDAQQQMLSTLGPAADRLSQTFPDRESYRAFWRAHPALGTHFSPDISDFADHDLVGEPPEMHPSTRREAMLADGVELFGEGPVAAAWRAGLPPVRFLWAPRGLTDQPPGLYPRATIDAAADRAGFTVRETPDNHYTVLMTDDGAGRVAAAVREALAG
ncbi:alpha/beta hydrolase [Nakamurella flavida]|uniref:Alpha/beta hydrolase n=1 Tax=Nakamurella flavida TaxID=363630 RepID=A0A938YHJ7_9ACTN|nr:alpha/beta hydrolase [Nakamurella flavida]MBM9475224.1 alpha/beta hydrolase [Nakamurella flavida]MDP9776797.1 pimeloyl-ACP methyl ester carboxylesterase [Nakamurella flavida]